MAATHIVTNQSVRLPAMDFFSTDAALVDAVSGGGADWARDSLGALGEVVGRPESEDLARDANRNAPVLRTHDRFGHRLDEVDFHPAYHRLMEIGKRAGVHALDWEHEGRAGAIVARAGLHYLYCQLEAGVSCPMTMTHAVVPSLRRSPELAAEWEPRVLARGYEPGLAAGKASVTFGMAMTEKQGGSDVRANTTTATPDGHGWFRLSGHKWFCSAPMSDAFLTLAVEDDGLSCFLVARVLPDGSRNDFQIQRLKDKLGNRSNASSEVEYNGTLAQRVGDPGRGVRTILDMVAQTRLDVAVGAAAVMRQALRYAVHHCRNRSAFGARLVDQPLMGNVLADLALEVEASVALAFRVAVAFERSASDPHEAAWARVLTPVSKYWLAKRVIDVTAESLECHGGNGYVEDFPMARLYREAPLGSIWEGSGNVQCLDVLRALQSDAVRAAVESEMSRLAGRDPRLDRVVAAVAADLGSPSSLAWRARALAGNLALAVQAGLLMDADADLGEAFLAGRTGGQLQFGTLPRGAWTGRLLERAG